MENIISIFLLKKSFKTNQILNDVSFNIPKGSIFALLGSNGAGKTTIVKILSTLLKADSGKVTVCGYDVEQEGNRVRECISLTGQFVAVDEILTGRENLKLIAELRKVTDIESKVSYWLKFFKLEDAANKKVSVYSGGMRRRLDIAMSLIDSPQVLFLDEPTTGLDPQNRIALWDLVKGLAKEGTTVFLTTQYLEEAEYLADNIAVLHCGKIIAEGTPEHLKKIMPKRGAKLNFQSEEEAEKAMRYLADSGIAIESIEQNLPSLEDVFLKLIDEKKEENSNE